MNRAPHKLNLTEWDAHYSRLRRTGLNEGFYGGPLRRHLREQGDARLEQLRFDESPAALRLWNFLLTENDRLREARAGGEKIVGTMKDLGTVPVMAWSLPGVRAFYPDGAWWTPCLMECSDRLLQKAENLGLDASFCPVRAMVPAFQNDEHFPRPDLLICSAGAICDDFSAIAQRLERLGHPILWWEIPRRRPPVPGEASCPLPGNLFAPKTQVEAVRAELRRVSRALGKLAGRPLEERQLAKGIRFANQVRRLLNALRQTVYLAPLAPLPALEMLVAEMLAIHFCSDREETVVVLDGLLTEAQKRVRMNVGVLRPDAIRIFWVNPVADLRAMNLLEDLGGRLCGSDFMITHALDLISEEMPPLEALACAALADPMVGPTIERAARITRECQASHAQALVISRIPGASHCAREGEIIRAYVRDRLAIPAIEIEVPPVSDALMPTLTSRLQALMETVKSGETT
ncbi:MAG: 2-hydroxyacyl-CoA dehydratase [Limisphaerales bacterium]